MWASTNVPVVSSGTVRNMGYVPPAVPASVLAAPVLTDEEIIACELRALSSRPAQTGLIRGAGASAITHSLARMAAARKRIDAHNGTVPTSPALRRWFRSRRV